MSFENLPQNLNHQKAEKLGHIGRKIALGTAVAASTFAGQAKELGTEDSVSRGVNEIAYESNSFVEEDLANPFNLDLEKKGLHTTGGSKEEGGPGGDEEVSAKKEEAGVVARIDITTFFEESNPEVSAEGAERINQTLDDFLSRQTQATLDGLRDKTLKLVAYVESSNTKVREGGLILKDGTILRNNYDFSRKRGMNTFDVTEKNLQERGFGDVEREVVIAQEAGYEQGTTSRNVREVQLAIEVVQQETVMSPEIMKLLDQYPEMLSVYEADVVVIDESGSMKEDADNVKNFIELVQKKSGKTIETLTLFGGDREAHAKTLSTLLEGNILVISDEADSTIPELYASGERRKIAEQEYKEYVDNLLNTSKAHYKMRILNPQIKKGGFKEFSLNEHPYAMITPDKGSEEFKGMSAGQRESIWYDSLPDDSQVPNLNSIASQ